MGLIQDFLKERTLLFIGASGRLDGPTRLMINLGIIKL